MEMMSFAPEEFFFWGGGGRGQLGLPRYLDTQISNFYVLHVRD